jgi:hypothetical protein
MNRRRLRPERVDSGRHLQMARIEAERAGIFYEEAPPSG